MRTIVYFLVLCAGVSYGKQLPSWIEVCHRRIPNLADCMVKNVEIIRPRLLKGIPELLIPSFNPLIIPEASLSGGHNFHANFKNIQVYHAEEFKLDNLKIDLDKFHLELDMTFARLRIKSTYKINGRLLILTLNGNGPADGNFTNVKAHLSADGERFSKRGQEHVKLADEKLDLNIGRPHFDFANLFGETNSDLNDQTNKIINENIEDIVNELKPVVAKVVGEFVFGVTNRIFDKFSMDELFPDP